MKVKEIAAKLNAKIIAEMEKGVVPWHCPWNRNFANGKPYAVNGVSKRAYTKCNYFFMNYLATQVYDENEFFTWGEIQKLGGRIKQGAQGAIVVAYFMVKPQQAENAEDTVEIEVAESDIKPRFALRYYYVYNRKDIEGLPPVKVKNQEYKPLENFQIIESAENVIKNYITCPEIKHEGRQAFYSPAKDFVQVPKKELFKNEHSYYSTLFHELVHSTGSKKRLNRDFGLQFGNEKYSKEELVAELGASYLRAYCGIDTLSEFQQSASYLDNWLKALKKDDKLFFEAATKAMKAVEYILNEAM
jgi:antirestriction protein ArdC